MNKDILAQYGIDYDDGIKRLLGNSMIFEKCLLKFPNDTSFARLRQALEAGDCAQAFNYAHNLKGLAGNLSMIRLFASANECCEALRAGNLQEGIRLFPAVEKDYGDALRALEEA